MMRPEKWPTPQELDEFPLTIQRQSKVWAPQLIKPILPKRIQNPIKMSKSRNPKQEPGIKSEESGILN